MLSKASSSKFYSIFFFFWFIMLMFIILQPITSARKLAGDGPRSKIAVHPSRTPTAPSAIGGGGGGGGHSSPTPATTVPKLSYKALQRGPVCVASRHNDCRGRYAPYGSRPRSSPPH
ncbi:hypothetical protein ACSBR2_006226 [Camellia fascicularis]